MTPVEVYRAGAWHELLAYKDHWLGTDPTVIVIPSDEEKGPAAAAFPEVAGGAIVTIPELIARYVKGLGKAGLISRHGLESILSTIISEAFTAYLHMEKYRQGYVKALTDFLYNFRTATLADLQAAFDTLKAGRLTLKEKDLVRIDAAFRQRLGELGFDLRGGLEEFLHHSGAADFDFHRHLGLPEKAALIFWGFDTLTPLEVRFIASAFENALRVVFLHCADPAASEQALRIQQSVIDLLEQTGAPPAVDLAAAPGPQDYFSALACSLFQQTPQPDPTPGPAAAESPGPAERLTVLKANDRFTEIVSVARRIRSLAQKGVSFDRIRVAAPAYDLYAAIIREVFPDYDIPFILEDGAPLLGFPLAALINNLVGHSVSANPFVLREKIFSSPYVTYELSVDPAALAVYQETAGVELLADADLPEHLTPGARCRLDYHALSRLRRGAYRAIQPPAGTHLLVLFKQYFDGAGNEADRPNDRFQALLQSYLLARAEKELSAWRSHMSAVEFKETVYMLMRRFQIAEKASAGSGAAAVGPFEEQSIREREERALEQINLVLEELEAVLAPLAQPAAERFPLADLARIFARLMLEARLPDGYGGTEEAACSSRTSTGIPAVSPRDAFGCSGPAVAVQRVDRGQYRRRDYTFICGLVDGEFPPVEEFNFLQPRKEGLGPGRAYTSVDLARNRFYQLIRATARGLCLSLPRSDSGRRLPPSPLLKEIEKQLPPPAAEEAPAAPGPADSGTPLYSRREKLLAVAGKVDHDYAGALPLLKELRREDEAMFDQIAAVMRFDGLTAGADRFCEFDGLFNPAGPAAPLLEGAVGRIDFTPEVLERYAACPLRFFFDDILGLKTEPDYHPDTAERGTAIRAILKEYTAAICAAGEAPAREAAALLHELTARHFERRDAAEAADAFQARFQKQLTAGLDGEADGRPGLFHAFLQYEAEGSDLLKPCRANLSGTVELSETLPVSVEIDRVDLTLDGGYCFLYRYTTAPGDPRRVMRGLRFDLPLMLLLFTKDAAGEMPAASAPDPATGLAPAAGAGFYLVKSPQALRRSSYFAVSRLVASRRHLVSEKRPIFSGQRNGLIDQERFPAALEIIANHIRRLHRLMKRGVFHPPLCEEAEQSCGNCTFGRLCRKDQARLDRLSPALRDAAEINLIKELI